MREIVLHCSATRPEWMQNRPFAEQVTEIRRWHVEGNRWRDIGYHHVIGRGGEHAVGRPEIAIGAHVAGRNNGTIGICLIGGHGSSERDQVACILPFARFNPPSTPASASQLRLPRFGSRSIRPGAP